MEWIDIYNKWRAKGFDVFDASRKANAWQHRKFLQSRRTPRALDLRESTPFQAESTPKVDPLAEVDTNPPANQ